MQIKKSMLILCAFLLTSVSTTQFVRANGVALPIYNSIYDYLLMAIVGFFLTILTECLVGIFLINTNRLETKSLLKIIFTINAITFPFAQLLGLIFFIFLLPLIIIEIIIIIIEWSLIYISYTKFRNKQFEENRNPKIVFFVYSLIANLLSFMVVLVVLSNFNTSYYYYVLYYL